MCLVAGRVAQKENVVEFVLGTYNQKKAEELSALLVPYGIQLHSLAEFDNAIEVEETGSTFAENAALKASEQAIQLQQWVIAEDSGLSVAALDGAPGIYSARFSGDEATDEKNNALLIERLANVPYPQRDAFYTCHIALANPTGEIILTCEDYCHGRIRSEPAGSGGFGYDPLFEVREYHKTFGELGSSVKSVLSHRSRALRRFIPQLLQVVNRELNAGSTTES
ncbi:MAG TPA: non-canonical purine NTP pyrophosphatase, RdgB/HAM1 family [Planctomycetaceae bacterium]|nr:non-canonical purine NTP pyrophosphatase, RdgB/HAM1 family [Blastopirellula sp.]HAY80751.1 non-canonical purine NTP pyrophosphatase, RdgB/HAM1 family [Planctomycetaceae bacterium]